MKGFFLWLAIVSYGTGAVGAAGAAYLDEKMAWHTKIAATVGWPAFVACVVAYDAVRRGPLYP